MKRVVAFLMALAMTCCLGFAVVSAAAPNPRPVDVGNFNDYGGGGGGYDGGGGGIDFGGSSSDGDGEFGIFEGIFLVVILVVVVSGALGKKKVSGRRGGSARMTRPGTMPVVPDYTVQITAAMRQYDPRFSMDRFLSWSKEVFITLQEAWTARDWEKIRPFEKETLYQQHAKQLQEYINLGRTNVIERININHAYPYAYIRDQEYEYLRIFMAVRMNDYIVDDRTGAVLQGSKDQPCYLQYILTFMRKTGLQTGAAAAGADEVECPHCGAPVSVTSAGKCDYCGFIITVDEHDWVLSDMMGVKPGVPLGPGGVQIRP